MPPNPRPLQLLRATAARWTDVNPVLEAGRPGVELDTGQGKFGNGEDRWADLPYIGTGGGGPHAASHQNGGGDEINVAGLSGVLADPQTPAAHVHSGADITTGTVAPARLGSGSGGATLFLREDSTWQAVGGGSTPTGTGFRHVTAGVEDAASKLVDTADVNNDQITYAKLQNAPAESVLLGRGQGSGAGDYQPIELGANLSMTGAILSASAGAGNFGTATVDFGPFPGGSDASVAVAAAGIGAGSIPTAWIFPGATADHSTDEHIVESLRVFAADVVAGVGFTIYARNDSEIQEPLEYTQPVPFSDNKASTRLGPVLPSVGGIGTRIYGTWRVGWQWA